MSGAWTADDRAADRGIRRDYYLELARVTWATMSPRQRRRLHRHDALVYSVLKGLHDVSL